MTAADRVSMQGIDKAFPGVQALSGATLAVAPGEVHVLLGENGAGKSTLMKILCGQFAPDRGTLAIDGVPYAPRSPHDAHARGVAMIHQELSSIGPLTVAENLLLGEEPARLGIIDRAEMRARTQALLRAVGADFAPDTRADALSVAERQLLEIAKALRREARVLIMDEPTAALTDAETTRLFTVIRDLTAGGVAVLYISHRMQEIFAIGDRVTIMRDGTTVDTRPLGGARVDELIAAMVGRPLAELVSKRSVPLGERRLVVEALASAAVGPVSFDVRAGEVFALAGLMGSGRTEVARAIFRADAATGGDVRVNGRPVGRGVEAAIGAGIGLVTEDRKAQGLLLDCSAAENITLAALDRVTRAGVIDLPAEERLAEEYRQRLRIRLPSVGARVRTLSGGNQQKLIIARWLAARCQVLILDEPTRGVDVGAKAEIYELIGALAAEGVAILLVSSDLPEVLGLGDRIGVMRERRLAGILERREASQERVMALAVAGA